MNFFRAYLIILNLHNVNIRTVYDTVNANESKVLRKKLINN